MNRALLTRKAPLALTLSLALAVTAMTAGCGGDDDDNNNANAGGGGGSTQPTANTLPASATQTTGSLVSYVAQLIAGNHDTAEPVQLGTAVFPTTETADPQSLN